MNKRLIWIAVFCLLTMSCSGGSRDITLVSWNVGVFSKSGQDSTGEAAALLRSLGADALALQELDSCNRRCAAFQLQRLADSLGARDYHFARAMEFAGGSYGNGVISIGSGEKRRSSGRNSGRFSLPLPRFDGAEPRSCAILQTKRYVLASVHLDHVGDTARLAQARALNDWFSDNYTRCGKPVILCGDFNSLPDSETLEEIMRCWEPLSGSDPTYPSEAPEKCLDYIFSLRSAAPVKVLSCTAVPSSASDHLPVVLKLQLPGYFFFQ